MELLPDFLSEQTAAIVCIHTVADASIPASCQCRFVHSLRCVRFYATPWTVARQASLSFTISQSLLKLMSIELVMPSNHLIPFAPFSSCPQSFPALGSFLMSQLIASGGQSIGTSASASVLPVNTQGWLPLGLTGLISLQNHIGYFLYFFFFLVTVCMQDLSSLTRDGPDPTEVEALSAETVHL